MDVIIREIGDSDIGKYRELRLRGLKDHPEAFGETPDQFVRKSLEEITTKLLASKKSGGFILGAFSGETIVGTVALRRETGEKSIHRGVLWGMYVLPEYRCKQVGFKLVKLLLIKAEDIQGLEQIHLAVAVSNTQAIRLYEKLGFKIYGTDPRVLRVESIYHDEHLMVRPLTVGQQTLVPPAGRFQPADR